MSLWQDVRFLWLTSVQPTGPVASRCAFAALCLCADVGIGRQERERRQLLDKLDARSYFEKQASFETEKEELRQLRRYVLRVLRVCMASLFARRARSNVGCQCTSPSACGTSRCLCFKEVCAVAVVVARCADAQLRRQHKDLACTDESCRCTCANCVNPRRSNFDQDRVNAYRKRRILEGAYTGDEPQQQQPQQDKPVAVRVFAGVRCVVTANTRGQVVL